MALSDNMLVVAVGSLGRQAFCMHEIEDYFHQRRKLQTVLASVGKAPAPALLFDFYPLFSIDFSSMWPPSASAIDGLKTLLLPPNVLYLDLAMKIVLEATLSKSEQPPLSNNWVQLLDVDDFKYVWSLVECRPREMSQGLCSLPASYTTGAIALLLFASRLVLCWFKNDWKESSHCIYLKRTFDPIEGFDWLLKNLNNDSPEWWAFGFSQYKKYTTVFVEDIMLYFSSWRRACVVGRCAT
jgi:hypothetical protein